MAIKQIQKINVSEHIFTELRKKIISGDLTPGEKIPSENELARLYNVSRVSIRDAISKLNVLGLLESKSGEGTFVKNLTPDLHIKSLLPAFALSTYDSVNLLEFRSLYEPSAVCLATKNITEEIIQELETSLELMIKHKEYNDPQSFRDADHLFHKLIAKATDNRMLIELTTLLMDISSNSLETEAIILNFEDSIDGHAQILTHIKNKDAVKAKEAMINHLNFTHE